MTSVTSARRGWSCLYCYRSGARANVMLRQCTKLLAGA